MGCEPCLINWFCNVELGIKPLTRMIPKSILTKFVRPIKPPINI